MFPLPCGVRRNCSTCPGRAACGRAVPVPDGKPPQLVFITGDPVAVELLLRTPGLLDRVLSMPPGPSDGAHPPQPFPPPSAASESRWV